MKPDPSAKPAPEPPPHTHNPLVRYFQTLGPGLVTGASDDDPSGIATYSVAGAAFGAGLLWTALFTFPLMAAIQLVCARIGLVTGRGLRVYGDCRAGRRLNKVLRTPVSPRRPGHAGWPGPPGGRTPPTARLPGRRARPCAYFLAWALALLYRVRSCAGLRTIDGAIGWKIARAIRIRHLSIRAARN